MSRRLRQNILVRTCCMAFIVTMWLPGLAGAATVEEDRAWTGGLKSSYFGDREILSDDVIALEAPQRAENAAIVPISIKAGIPQTEELYIRTIWLFVDRNPGPLVGKFHFTPASGRADLGLRLRINTYSPVRAIAETSDGALHMSRLFVKASGGCSAPASSNLEAALQDLGKMRFQLPRAGAEDASSQVEGEQSTVAQLMIRHPNVTGLQMDQVTRHYAPAQFVKEVKVSFEGEQIFRAETTFAVSENPIFRFYFAPQQEGVVTAEVSDTEGRQFSESYDVSPLTGTVAARR